MAINIKELFSSDTDKDHLDKLNYNFDQIVANGGGPIGAIGAKGDLGPQGNKGSKGDQGVAGPQGAAGIATDYFFRNDNGFKFTYTPMPDDLTAPSGYTRPASFILGDAPADLISSNAETEALLYIKQFDHPYLIKLGTDDTDEYITISISADGIDRDITFAPTAIGTSTQNWKFFGNSITLNGGASDVIKLDVTASEIASSLLLSGGLKITSGTPGVDKVLTSDAAGNASWQAPFETPIGTIVMVPKFILDNNVNWVTSGVPGADYVGRGINDWAGWYYCWGQTWGLYETPDMREAMPIGYVNTNIDGAGGYSPEVYNADSPIVTNKARVDALQSLNTAYTHTHTTSIGSMDIEEEIDGNPITTKVLQPINPGTSNFVSGNPSTSTNNVNAAPPATVLGYMIYLGSPSLTYGAVALGGGGGPIGA